MKNKKTLLATALMVATLLPSLTSCGFTYCQHKLETIKGTPATCLQDGVKSHYKCEFCDQLFGYDRYGIYEIDAPEADTSGKHDLTYLPVQRGTSNSLSRVKFGSYCKICHKDFEIDADDYLKFAPGTQVASSSGTKAQHILEDQTIGTTYTFKAGTPANEKTTIWRDQDTVISGTRDLYTTNVPYVGGKITNLMLMFRNETEKDIRIKYCAEDNGARCYASSLDGEIITIKANSLTAAHLPVKFTATQPGCCHEIYLLDSPSIETKLTVWGAYLPSTYESLSVTSGKMTYKVGERFTVEGLVLTANYVGQTPKTKVVDLEECEIPLRGKILDTSHKLLKVVYRGIVNELPLTVYNPDEYNDFRFNGTPVTDYEVGDVIDYDALSFIAVYGKDRTLANVELTIDDVEHEKIIEPLTEEDNNRTLSFTYKGKTISFKIKVKGGNN